MIFMEGNHWTYFNTFVIAAIYLTATICVSAVWMIVQMVILNFYHKAPLVPVPDWIKRLTHCLACQRISPQVGSTPVDWTNNKDDNTEDVQGVDDTFNDKHLSGENNVLYGEVCKITNEIATHTAEEVMREEWQVVARVMDRFCFWFFVLLQVILVVASFGVIPDSWIPRWPFEPRPTLVRLSKLSYDLQSACTLNASLPASVTRSSSNTDIRLLTADGWKSGRTSRFNSVWPSDTIWGQRSGSTLAQVMACCLTVPSHYLNQCWLFMI